MEALTELDAHMHAFKRMQGTSFHVCARESECLRSLGHSHACCLVYLYKGDSGRQPWRNECPSVHFLFMRFVMTLRMVKLPNVSITYGTIFTTLGAAVSLGT
jgi:hypothetical protein